jgi:hypothetical protein
MNIEGSRWHKRLFASFKIQELISFTMASPFSRQKRIKQLEMESIEVRINEQYFVY